MASRRSQKDTTPAPPSLKPSKTGGKHKAQQNEADAAKEAAADAARDAADMEEATETAQADPSAVPIAVYQCRLEKSKNTVETLQKGKAEMEKQVAELKEAEKKRKDEEARAAKFSKTVENSSPGAVVQVGRQVIYFHAIYVDGS